MKYLSKIKLIKENFEEEVKLYLAHLTDDNFQVDVNKILNEDSYLTRIWKPQSISKEYSYENSQDFDWIDIEDDLARLVTMLNEQYNTVYFYTISSKDQDGLGFKRTEWNVDNLIKQGTFGYANPGKIKCVLFKIHEL